MSIILRQEDFKFGEIRWYCDNITDVIDTYYTYTNIKPWSYINQFDLSDDFRVNTEDHWIIFTIRHPGCTIGYFKCDAFGKILEIKIYEDVCKYHSILNDKLKRLIGKDINIVELAKIEFVNNNMKINSKANINILWFIANFIYHQPDNYITSSEIIHNQFRAGYCLHFAIILKTLFKSGEICWTAPYGHMVYVHDNIPYDIEGINTSDCEHYIPISYIKNGIADFTRVPGDYFNASQEYINNAIKKYKKDNKIE